MMTYLYILETRKLICEQSLYGTITEKQAKYSNAKVTVYDNQFKVIHTGFR
jgi:hypothetical protein